MRQRCDPLGALSPPPPSILFVSPKKGVRVEDGAGEIALWVRRKRADVIPIPSDLPKIIRAPRAKSRSSVTHAKNTNTIHEAKENICVNIRREVIGFGVRAVLTQEEL